MRATIVEQVVSLASVLDSQHKPSAPIRVAASRATLMPVFKPRERGGPLYVGEHEIVLAKRPAKCPDTLEMFPGVK